MSLAELNQHALTGQLSADDPVCRDGMKDWIAAHSVAGLHFSKPAPPPPPARSRRPTPAKISPQIFLLGAGCLAMLFALVAVWQFGASSQKPVAKKSSLSPPAQRERTAGSTTPPTAPVEAPPAKPTAPPTPVIAEIPEATTAPEPVEEEPALAPIPDVTNDEPTPPIVTEEPASAPNIVAQESPAEKKQLYQELKIAKQSAMAVQGVNFAMRSQYRIFSKLEVGPPNAQGLQPVEQTVLGTNLDECDDLSRDALSAALQALRGQRYQFQLDADGKVHDFRGAAPAPESRKVDALGGGFLVVSAMDADGFAELARSSFFQPRLQSQQGDSWRSPMHHDWGPLGAWQGEVEYTMAEPQQDYDVVAFAYRLDYSPPVKRTSALPFEPSSARFKTGIAGGMIHYDRQRGRVQSAVEKFQAEGELTAELLGQRTKLLLSEQQQIDLVIYDQNPWNDNRSD